jgi:hypothetical protein
VPAFRLTLPRTVSGLQLLQRSARRHKPQVLSKSET